MSTHEYPKEMIDPGADAPAAPERLRSFVERMEWSGWGYNQAGEGKPKCPDCGNWQDEGHAESCGLAALLAAPVAPADGWENLKVYGYAPGDYMSRCHKCGLIPAGLDKRAVTCRPCAEAMHAAAPAELPTTRSQRMRDAGFTRRPTWHSLPGDDEPTPVAPVGMAYVPLVMTQAMRDVTDSEGWTWEDLLAEAGSISQEEYAAIAAAPVAPAEPVSEQKPAGLIMRKDDAYRLDSLARHAFPLRDTKELRSLVERAWWLGAAAYESAAAPVAPANPTHLRRADGTLSGVFIEQPETVVTKEMVDAARDALRPRFSSMPSFDVMLNALHAAMRVAPGLLRDRVSQATSEAAAVADDLRNWFDFLPGHAQPTVERAVRLLETKP